METHEFCCWFVSSIYWIHLRFMDKYHEWIIKKTGSILHVYTVVNKYMNHLFFMIIIYYNILFIICNM
jgi:hypothetical protein